MKKISIFIFALCIFSCATKYSNHKSVDGSLIMLDKEQINKNCGTGFYVSFRIEDDLFYNRLLCQYLYACLIDYSVCDTFPKEMFKRNSFIKLVNEVYRDPNFENYSIYEYKNRWIESYPNLLFKCDDLVIRLYLCDMLLKNNIDDGLIPIWNENASKLKYLELFSSNTKASKFSTAALVVLFHNNNMKIEEEKKVKALMLLDKVLYNKIKKIISHDKVISYSSFMEEIYGGY